MLKRVAIADLEVGMFVHKMEGNWFSHPFWKAKFLIDDAERLDTLRSSNLDGVVIDTSKGRDLAAANNSVRRPGKPPVTPSAASQPDRFKSVKARSVIHNDPVSTEAELHTAQAIAARAQKAIHSTFIAARLGKAINVKAVQPVVTDILDSVRRNPHAFSGLMRCKLKNELGYQHALAVSALMVSLARQMKLAQDDVLDAGLAGLLLDIGTNYLPQVPDLPNNDFRNADPKIWQQHVILGFRALQHDDSLPQAVLNACLEHHERIDGGGFPKGLQKDEISTIGQMAAICDTFDFLLTGTANTGALDPAAAVQHLRKMEGAFDPDILRSFVESVGLYPVGSFVELRSGKIALVIDEDPGDKSQPIVQAFFDCKTRDRIVPHRIILAQSANENEIIGTADLSGFDLPDEAQLREMVFLTAHKMVR
ncbi:HD-GYP domain-containing protein (c-di-GMP phosphodiesterase class II) [Porphyrobacter sp. MBR-155]|jgi:HD-GYP domain-containing protein (c-di-GMP phosphodiesterase class II)|uniref:HD-GYP domain-containing protein n=1 Tax=Porphyrobacter sp. MBR-155 TaxID=3156464 RepID=UPI0033990592